MYFCCVEALQNATRHAEATAVSVQLREDHDALVFEVRDDGRGFSAVDAPHSGGLAGMRDRLEAIGGTLRVDSAPGIGTTVSGVAPLGTHA